MLTETTTLSPGDRVKATRPLYYMGWPTRTASYVVKPGEFGTVTRAGTALVHVAWDDDPMPHRDECAVDHPETALAPIVPGEDVRIWRVVTESVVEARSEEEAIEREAEHGGELVRATAELVEDA